MSRIIAQLVRGVLNAADQHGAKIKPTLRQSLSAQIEQMRAATNLDLSGPSVADTVMAALSDGRNPVEDPAVVHAIVRERLGSGETTAQLTDVARNQLTATVTENADAIVAAFQPAYNTAAAALTNNADVLRRAGIEDLEARALTRANVNVATAAATAREAIKTLNDINNALSPLLQTIGRLDGSPLARVVRIVEPGNATASELLRLPHGDPWAAVLAGFTVSLGTPSEIRERVAQANNATAHANHEASRDRVQEARAEQYARSNA